MFDESKENQNPIENPYLAGEPQQENNFSPIPEEPEKKSSNKVVIGVIAGAVVLFLAIILVLVFGGLFKNDKQTVMTALKDTFKESGEYISDVWEFEEYEGMFEEGVYTLDAQFDLPDGVGVDMVVQSGEDVYGIYVDGSIAGSSMIEMEIYSDEEEIVISLPDMLDYMLTINRATMADDIQNMVNAGILDQETADELVALNEGEEEIEDGRSYQELQEQIIETFVTFWEECEVKKGDSKKLTVNDKEVNCKGYVMVVTKENLTGFVKNLKAAYQDHEEDVEVLLELYAMYDLDELYEDFDVIIEGCEELEKDFELEFYLYDGVVAQIYMDTDEDIYFEWDMEGGNFPLENTRIILGDRENGDFVFSRTGSDKTKYQVKYEMGDEDDAFAFEVKYSRDKGSFTMEFTENSYGDEESVMYVKGSLEKTGKSELALSIDSLEIEEEMILSGDIVIEDTCDEIKRPGGEEKELFRMTEEELEDMLWDIVMSMY